MRTSMRRFTMRVSLNGDPFPFFFDECFRDSPFSPPWVDCQLQTHVLGGDMSAAFSVLLRGICAWMFIRSSFYRLRLRTNGMCQYLVWWQNGSRSTEWHSFTMFGRFRSKMWLSLLVYGSIWCKAIRTNYNLGLFDQPLTAS